jgi:gliding motility-associated-like protein
VQVLPLGAFSINGPDTLCAYQEGTYAAALSNASLSSIAWSSGADSTNILFASSASTPLYAVATDTNNCTYSDTIDVHINPGPQAAFTFNTPSCDSLITFLNGSVNSTDQHWDLGNGENSTMVSPVGHYTGFGNYTIELIALNACGSDTSSQQLTLGQTGTLALLGPDSLCMGQQVVYAVDLQGPDISTVQWSLSASDSASAAISLSYDSLLSVTVIGADGCQYSDSLMVQVLHSPTVAFDLTPLICAHSVSSTNTSNGAISYQWNFGDGQSSNAVQPTHIYNGYGSFTVTLAAINNCGSQDTTAVIALIPPGSFSIVGPDTLCADQTGLYTSTLTGASLGNITWNSGSDSTSTAFSTSINAVVYAMATDTDNCTYADTIQVHVTPDPIAAFTFNPLPCDSVIGFNDASNEASSWEWDLGNGSSSTLAQPFGHYPDDGTFTVEEIVMNACGSDTVSHQLTLGPIGLLDLAGPDPICAEQAGVYSIELQGPGISSVQWSLGSGDSTSIALSFSNNSILDVTVLGNDGCTYEDSLAIHVLPLPVASFSSLADPCDSTATFSNTSFYADSYAWDFGNGETSTSPSPTASFDPSVGYEVILIASNACGMDTAQHALAFDPIPQLQLVGPPTICSDKPVQFHISYEGTGLHDVHWSTGDTTATITTGTTDGEVIQVVAVDDLGCMLESSYVVQYIGDGGVGAAYIPNVFTPNKDGFNESFGPVILQGFISMEIFNRWGQEIYETAEIHNPWHGDFKGVPVPDGTYVYIVKWNDQCTGDTDSRIGSVTLLR